MAIGARSQSARTFLEKNLDSFLNGNISFDLCCGTVLVASLDELANYGLVALRECLPNDAELTSKACFAVARDLIYCLCYVLQNVSICIIGESQKLEILDNDKVQPYVSFFIN